MTFLKLAGAGALAVLSLASVAQAAQGCGPGLHRGPYGACRPNRGPGPVVVAPYAPRLGAFYHGRGWWDGHRYWANRYQERGAWRYR